MTRVFIQHCPDRNSRYQITDVASVSRSGLCINESPSGTAVVAPWVICGFL